MVKRKVTAGGQISLPAEIRRRWGADAVFFEDLGDRAVVRPIPADPIGAARGALKGKLASTDLRAAARNDEERSQARRR
jgi:bifunctional DNA-binding transcriptional regulator/antitoxin component of YhaV-PrlF toxin-antitoxin module